MTSTVARLGFAPVKGTRHLARPAIRLDADGPVGDREWCLIETERSRVLRTVGNPLIHVSVDTRDDHLQIATADGRSVAGRVYPDGDPRAVDYWGRPAWVTPYAGAPADFLSALVDRPVTLARAARGAVVFGAPVSLVGTASLGDLARRMGRPDLIAESERFRSTVLVETDEPWVEDTWLGRDLRLGGAVVRVRAPIGRCAVPNLNPVDGSPDASVLKALAGFRPSNERGEPVMAVDASVVGPGMVRLGDVVDLGE